MSAIPEVSQDSLSVCLGNGNPNRLLTLWNVLQIHAHRFVKLLIDLYTFEMGFHSGILIHDIENFAIALILVREGCEHFGAVNAIKQLDRINRVMEYAHSHDKPVAYDELSRMLGEFRTRVQEDLENEVFFRVECSKAMQFFERQKDYLGEFVPKSVEDIFGDKVAENFSGVLWDGRESVDCFVAGRYTACVFHLMRVLELGLGVLGKRFKVSVDHADWGTIIGNLENAIANIHNEPDRPDEWKDQREFYNQCLSHFRVLKDAWRNYTAHSRGRYDRGEAFDIFNNVRGFMQKLATRHRADGGIMEL